MHIAAGDIEELILPAGPHRWRVLKSGMGPVALCLHGAGGSADSFKPLMGALSSKLTIVAPDLPGHGGTRLGSSARSGLEPIAEDVAMLLDKLRIAPEFTIGHSAGAAVSLELDQVLSPQGHVLINAALSEFEGLAGWVFPAMAKGLSLTPFAADFLARNLSRDEKLRGLLESTGSDVTEEILLRYQGLAQNREHVNGTLKMMAAWDLKPLLNRMRSIRTRTLLVAANKDGTVPVSVSKKAKQTLYDAELILHEGGHLLHEERPQLVADDISRFFALPDT